MIKPPFKWAGGKTKMIKVYEPLLQDTLREKKVFVDGFFGAGAMSLWVYEQFPHMDIVCVEYNAEMTAVYDAMVKDIDEFLRILKDISDPYVAGDDKKRYDYYYEQRTIYSTGDLSSIESAARLYFMLRTCFNGIWVTRVKCNGRFGTPPGGRNEKQVYIESDVRAFAEFLKNVTFITGDYSEAQSYVGEDTFVYSDPPYRDSFTPYGGVFDDVEQARLCAYMNECASKGASVAMSNKLGHDGFWDEHLEGWYRDLFNVKYTAGVGATTAKAVEVLFTNFKKG